jgi:hypothetical protein
MIMIKTQTNAGMIENQNPLLAMAISFSFSGVFSVDSLLVIANIVPNRPTKIIEIPMNPINITPPSLFPITIDRGNKMTPREVAVMPLIRLAIDSFDLFIKFSSWSAKYKMAQKYYLSSYLLQILMAA